MSEVTTKSAQFGILPNDIGGIENRFEGGLAKIADKIGSFTTKPQRTEGTLRMWKHVWNYKGDDPEREGNRMVTGEIKGKNGGDVHLEYNPEKVASGEKVLGKDYVVEAGNPGSVPYDTPDKEIVWYGDHRELHGDTLYQVAAADAHGITGDQIEEKINKDGSLKSEGKTGKGIVSNEAKAVGGGECCVFNNYGGGGCGACNRGAGPDLIPELLLTLHETHHTQHMDPIFDTKDAASYTPAKADLPKGVDVRNWSQQDWESWQQGNMSPQREGQIADIINKRLDTRYVKMQIRDQYEKQVDQYVKEEIHNNSSSYNPTKSDVIHATNRATDLGADTRTIVASQTEDLKAIANDSGIPFNLRNEAQDRINSIRGSIGKIDDQEKFNIHRDAETGKLGFDNENYQVTREGGLASQHLKAMDEKRAALKDPEVQKDLARAKREAGMGGGGSGECCIHNEYGGGGCGECNRGGGPELELEKYNFDNFFGKDKSPQQGMQPYVDKNGRVFVRFWAIGPGVNRHEWGANTDYIAANMPSLPGKDITFMKQVDPETGKVTYPHPALRGATPEINEQFQKNWKIGTALDYERTPDKDGNWYGIGEITDHHAKEFFADLYNSNKTAGPSANLDLPIYVSPQIIHRVSEPDPTQLKKFWFQHITLTDDPAYSPNIAKITSSCVGDEAQCMASLKQASMARLNMGCIKMALEELLANNVVRTIKNASNSNTSLISKDASVKLDNSMTDNPSNESKDTQNSNTNSNPMQPEFAQPQAIDPSKFNESIKEMIAKSMKEGNLTDREKMLLEQVEQLNNSLKTESDKNTKLNEKITGIESRESRRNIELLLIPYEKAFKNEKGQFDEKKFNENVDYWLSKNQPIETVKKDLDMAMGYAMANIPESPRTDAYASGAGQSSEGQSMTDIYEAPTVGANLPEDKETKNASMSGNELVDPSTLYFISKKGGRVI